MNLWLRTEETQLGDRNANFQDCFCFLSQILPQKDYILVAREVSLVMRDVTEQSIEPGFCTSWMKALSSNLYSKSVVQPQEPKSLLIPLE